MDLLTPFHTVDELSADELKQLYLHIMQTHVQFVAAPKDTPPSPHILGLFEKVGETWMSTDFDAALPDSFWLGEDQA